MAGISITLAGNFSKLDELKEKSKKAAKSVKDDFDKFKKTDSFKGLAVGATVAFGAIVLGAKEAIEAASDLDENIAKTGQVFKTSSGEMLTWASTASRSFGLSKNSALDAASSMGNLFTAMGVVPDKAAEMSKRMVELSADLASFNNTSIEDAVESIGSALRGEAEPIRKYGVLLNDATLQAKAFAMGISNGKDTLSPANKAMAAYGLILEQTETAQGDFTRTADGLANTMRTVKAMVGDASAEIGQGFLPTAEKGTAALRDMLEATDFQAVGMGIADVTEKMTEWGGAISEITQYLPGVIAMKAAMNGLFGGDADKEKAQAMADALNAADPNYMKETGTGAQTSKSFIEDEADATPAAQLDDKAIKKAEADKKAAEAKEKSRAAALEEYNIESAMLSARLKGDNAKLAALEREKKIRTEMKQLESAGFTSSEARGPAEAKVNAEELEASKERAKARAAALEERKIDSDMLAARLKGDAAKVASLEREKKIREQMKQIKASGLGGPNTRQAAEAQVDAEALAAAKEDAAEKATDERQKIKDTLEGKLEKARDAINGQHFESTLGAVSSMQRVGGGGGAVSSGLDYARQSADLQREANSLIRQLIEINRPPVD